MKRTFPIISLALLIAACERPESSNSKTGSTKSLELASNESDDNGVKACVERIKTRVDNGLPSYLRIGEAKIELNPVVGKSRRGVMLLPVVTNEELYKLSGRKLGDKPLVTLQRKKDDVEVIKFRLIGDNLNDGSWMWRDEIEEDVIIHRDVRPLSAFQNAIVQDSPEHLDLITTEAENKQRDVEKLAALDAAARKEKLPPLDNLLKPGKKAVGMIGNKYYHLTVTSADPAGASWTFEGHTMASDGKKIYSDKGSISIRYNSEKREVEVKEVTLGAMTGIRNAAVTVEQGSLHFKGGRLVTTQGFKFE